MTKFVAHKAMSPTRRDARIPGGSSNDTPSSLGEVLSSTSYPISARGDAPESAFGLGRYSSEKMDSSFGEPAGPAGRRKFLAGVVWAMGGVIAATLAGLLARFFAAPIFARSRRGSGEVALGPVARFRDAKDPVLAFYERRLADGYLESVEKGRVYVVAEGGRFLCLSTTCTHLGCSVSWDAERQRFLCPCHGGAYARDGAVVAGPPPRGLVEIPLRVENGQLKIRVEESA